MSVEYNAVQQGNEQTREGETGQTEKFNSNDIRHDSFNLGNMHFGSTGADNDNMTPVSSERMNDLVLGAREVDMLGFKGAPDGQQSPRDGKPGLN